MDNSTLMLIIFILLLTVSIWKIYAFLPNKQLTDDDTTEASKDELNELMLKVICKNNGDLTTHELFEKMTNEDNFDTKHYWRFNHNRLNQLLNQYYLENSQISTIKDIFKKAC